MCIRKFRPVKGLLKLLVALTGNVQVVCWEFMLLCWGSLIQPAVKEVIVKLYDKQKLPCLYEEDDFFPITN